MRAAMVFCIAALAALCAAGGAGASGVESVRDYHLSESRNYFRDLADARAVLESRPQAEWTQKDQEAYLFNALFGIYFATNAYVCEKGVHPGSRSELAAYAGIAEWPGNPYRDWAPLEWQDYPAGEFVPGGLVRQLCPADQWSVPESPRPKTYVISINGPAADFSPSDSSALKTFFKGSTIPEGSAFIAGAGWDSAAKTLERREKSRKAAEEARKNSAD